MHIMNLISEHEGTEEWLCSTCGRHLLVNWHPRFKRTVIEPGDPSANHGGFKNDSQAGHAEISFSNETFTLENGEQYAEESRLVPWSMWMEKKDFENLWNKWLQ